MSDRALRVKAIESAGVIAVIRTSNPDSLPEIAAALIQGGIQAIEITLTTPRALTWIQTLSRDFSDQLMVGAGTVCQAEDCHRAIDSGAVFIVSPVGAVEIIEPAHAASCPVMLGSYSPTEAYHAHTAGSDFVKIFPANDLGPDYIKAIRAPLPMLKIIPTGGVTVENVGLFIDAGCVAVGVGGPLIKKAYVEKQDWNGLAAHAKAFMDSLHAARGSNKPIS